MQYDAKKIKIILASKAAIEHNASGMKKGDSKHIQLPPKAQSLGRVCPIHAAISPTASTDSTTGHKHDTEKALSNSYCVLSDRADVGASARSDIACALPVGSDF